MSKRDTSTDVPRRIYLSTIERIDKHLKSQPREFKKSKRKGVKGDFNKFLITMLDAYEWLQSTKVIYMLDGIVYNDPMEARGQAIKKAVKTRKPVSWPDVYAFIGEDVE